MFGVQPFTQPLYRFDVLPRDTNYANHPWSYGRPAPTAQANTTQYSLDPKLVKSYPQTGNPAVDNFGPIEGRPPGST